MVLTEKLKAIQPDCEVVSLTGSGTVETAVQSMRLGTFDYLKKPCLLADLEIVIERAVARRQLTKDKSHLTQVLASR